jgi:hypothetical protein
MVERNPLWSLVVMNEIPMRTLFPVGPNFHPKDYAMGEVVTNLISINSSFRVA